MESSEEKKINEAKKEQERLFALVGENKWSLFRKHEHYLLKLKLALLMFGASNRQIDDDESLLVMILEDGYFTQEQFALMEELYQLMLELVASDRLEVGFLFVSLLLKEEVRSIPIIRLHLPLSNEIKFIDCSKRVYESWEDFQEYDDLPACKYVYPLGGWYRKVDGKLELEVAESRREKTAHKVALGFDITSGVVGGLSVVLGISGAICSVLIPPVGIPLLISSAVTSGTSSAYGLSRSIYTLHDRGSHRQTLSLADSGARAAWLGVGASAVGIVSCGFTAFSALQVARAGITTGAAITSAEIRIVQAVSNLTNISRQVANIVDIIITAMQNGELTLEVLMKIMYHLFLSTHLLISRNTLRGIGCNLATAEIPRVFHFLGTSPMANFLYNLGDTLRSLIEKDRAMNLGKVEDIYLNLRRGYSVEREEAGSLTHLKRKMEVSPYHLDMFWQYVAKALNWQSEDLRKVVQVCDAIALSIFLILSRKANSKEVDALSLLSMSFSGLKKTQALSSPSCLEGVDGNQVAETVIQDLLQDNLDMKEELVPAKYWLKVRTGNNLKVNRFSEFLFDDPELLPSILNSDSVRPVNWSTLVKVSKFPSDSCTLYEITFLPRVNFVLKKISEEAKTSTVERWFGNVCNYVTKRLVSSEINGETERAGKFQITFD